MGKKKSETKYTRYNQRRQVIKLCLDECFRTHPTAMVITDHNGHILKVNEACRKLSGSVSQKKLIKLMQSTHHSRVKSIGNGFLKEFVKKNSAVRTSPTRGKVRLVLKPTPAWIRAHEPSLVAVLSCTPERQEMLQKALTYWTSIGAHVLLFVPHWHADFFGKFSSKSVKIVSYTVKEPEHMFVGHSRNAVLQFCFEHKKIIRSMAIADERIYRLTEWTESFTFRSSPEQRFFLLKEFLASGSVPRSRAATDMDETFQYIEKNNVSLVSISDNKRNRNRKYTDVNARNPVIAQLVLFPVGKRGWDGECWYAETAMGEDIHFSYEWSLRLGGVMECRTITMLRSGGKTITRRRQDISTYSDDNLAEVMKIMSGPEYHSNKTFSWYKNAPQLPMSIKRGRFAYNEMELLFKSVNKAIEENMPINEMIRYQAQFPTP